MSRGERSNIDQGSLLSGGRDLHRDSHSDYRDLEASGDASSPLTVCKSWWNDPTKRRYIIGSIVGVVTLLLVIIIVAVATRGKRHSDDGGGGGGVVSSSTGLMAPSSTAAPPPPPFNPETPWLFDRLPNSTTASNYLLWLTFDVDSYRFNGSEAVTLATTRPLDHLLLHSVGLTWSSVSLKVDSGDHVPLAAWQYGPYLVLNLSSVIPPQQSATLLIAFQGQLIRGQQNGTYPGYYQDNGVEKLLVSTQFEASSARRAFPCLDEPALKATFDISISNSPKYTTVLSNQEVISQTTGSNGWLTTYFATTPVMSTYLVAWVVAQDYVAETRIAKCNGKNVTSSVWVPRVLKNSSYVSADLAAQQIEFFCQYYQMDYPMAKQDHCYIPQFAAGAMENWGLITYRDNAILWDPRVNTIVQLQRVALVIAHELAHQWFGNIVTASWWSQLWLNEGFARFMQFVAGDAVSPELQLTDQFITIAQRQALVTDSSANTHPVVNEQSLQSLSDIIYAKGASVLRMIVGLIGADVFESGIRQYLLQYQYKSTVTSDLFTVLDQAVKQAGGTTNVTEVMREWSYVAGYPVVSCDAASQADGSYVWTCSQQRYYSYAEPNPADSTWTIPLTLSTPVSMVLPNLVWPIGQKTFSFTLPSTPSFVKLNTNTTGFYRVLYSAPLWMNLGQALRQPGFGGIHHDDRVGLVNDLFVFLDKGLVSPTLALNVSVFLTRETSFVVWTVATPALLNLWNRVKYQYTDPQGLADMRDYISQLMSTVAQRVSFQPKTTVADEVLETLLGPTIARFDLGRRAEVERLYQRVAAGEVKVTDLPPNVVDLVLQVGMEATTGNVFDSFVYKSLYRGKVNTTGGQDPNDPYATLGYPSILQALASTQDPASLNQIFQRAADPAYFRPEDAGAVIRLAAANDMGLPLINAFLNSTQYFALWNASLSQVEWGLTLQTTLGLHTWPSVIASLSDFMAAQTVTPYVRQRITAGLATANVNAQWISAHWPAMSTFLQSRTWVIPSSAVR